MNHDLTSNLSIISTEKDEAKKFNIDKIIDTFLINLKVGRYR